MSFFPFIFIPWPEDNSQVALSAHSIEEQLNLALLQLAEGSQPLHSAAERAENREPVNPALEGAMGGEPLHPAPRDTEGDHPIDPTLEGAVGGDPRIPKDRESVAAATEGVEAQNLYKWGSPPYE